MTHSRIIGLLGGFRRAMALLASVTVLTLALAGTAFAFVPPGGGAGNFGCGPANHPGSAGQFTAMDASSGLAAWNAHVNSSQVTNC